MNLETDVREVSIFPAPGPQTPPPGSGRSRGDFMAQTPHAPVTPLPHSPNHQMMRGSSLTKPLGYSTSILSPKLLSPPFRHFCNSPAPCGKRTS